MSFIDGSLIDDNYALIVSPIRDIGGIIPDVTIEEQHSDRLTTTEHPVETGAAITDHSFRNPSELVMRVGFSNSTAGSEGWVQVAYEMCLALQQTRQPFDVVTGKRLYSNMLITELTTETDRNSEFTLNIVVNLREVIIVSTSQSTSPGIAPQSAQAMPSQTAPVTAAGSQALSSPEGLPTFAQAQAAVSGGVPGPFQ